MTVENFIWNSQDQSVSWKHNGETIKEIYENAYFATVNTQQNFVYIEAGENYHQDQVYYISFDGRQIFKFDKLRNKVSWLYQNKMVEVSCENLVNAQFYIEKGVIMVITDSKQFSGRLQAFTLNGIKLFEKEPPQGYSFVNLSTYKDEPSVVCDAGKSNADTYGRSCWHFSIDIKTGSMSKENLAY